MIKNQTAKPNSRKCNNLVIYRHNNYSFTKEYLNKWGGGGGEYSPRPKVDEWSDTNTGAYESDQQPVLGWDGKPIESSGLGTTSESAYDGYGGVATTAERDWAGNPIESSAFGTTSESAYDGYGGVATTAERDWAGESGIDYSPDWGTSTPAAQDSIADKRGPEEMKGRLKRAVGRLGSLGRRGFGKTEGMRSAAMGVAEKVQTDFGETASDLYSTVQESVGNLVKDPRTKEAITTYATSLGTTCLEGAGVIKETKHWEGVAGTGYRPSATGITRAAINPFGAARRGLMAGGDQVVRDLMQAQGGLTKKGVQYVEKYAAQQNPFMRFAINRALKRAEKNVGSN